MTNSHLHSTDIQQALQAIDWLEEEMPDADMLHYLQRVRAVIADVRFAHVLEAQDLIRGLEDHAYLQVLKGRGHPWKS